MTAGVMEQKISLIDGHDRFIHVLPLCEKIDSSIITFLR